MSVSIWAYIRYNIECGWDKWSISSIRETLWPIHSQFSVSRLAFSKRLTVHVFCNPIIFCDDLNQPIMSLLSNFKSVLLSLSRAVSCRFSDSLRPSSSAHHPIQTFGILSIPSQPPPVCRPWGAVSVLLHYAQPHHFLLVVHVDKVLFNCQLEYLLIELFTNEHWLQISREARPMIVTAFSWGHFPE